MSTLNGDIDDIDDVDDYDQDDPHDDDHDYDPRQSHSQCPSRLMNNAACHSRCNRRWRGCGFLNI